MHYAALLTLLMTIPGESDVHFNRDIRPILSNHCFKCHGADLTKGGLSLLSREGATKKLRSGQAALVPGQSSASEMITRVCATEEGERMPPKGPRLSVEQIAKLKAWIDQGAVYEQHWAYVKPLRPVLAPSKDNPIDVLVRATLEREGLKPSSEADRTVLLRRVSLDLIGLPPSPAEVEAFVRDPATDAYEKAVDRLLASPHYGEHQARFWLDLARYADTNGYEKDSRRSIWPYRDWVINAFNQDLPFDRFTIEQIAGDLLPGATTEQRIATGFHRNTMVNTEGGIDDEEFRVAAVVDRVNTTMEVWMGSTFGCAQCHNHKFDPFTMKEYYGVLAFFNNTTDHGNSTAPEIPAMSPLWARQQEAARAEVARLEKVQTGVGLVLGLPGTFALQQQQREQIRVAASFGPATTLVLQELPRPRTTKVMIRGNHKNLGDEVKPGVPASLHPLPKGTATPNRLAFAKWLVAPENPLVGRVIMNRIWARYFGKGLVETTEDFGYQGEPPTHPEVLDFLAVEMVNQRWSLKAMHRLIVTSATYRQTSSAPREVYQRDPFNRLLARGSRFRLDAEQIRDNALAISGLLDHRLGGPSVFPYQPDGVWLNPYSGDRWTTGTGGSEHRRGLYTFWRRTAPYASFMAFDAPSREVVCDRRPRTNTPLQALATLNDKVFVEASAALARRVLAEASGDEQRLDYAFRLCVARKPTTAELDLLTRLYRDNLTRYQKDPAAARLLVKQGAAAAVPGMDDAVLAAWTVLANLLLNLDETVTRG
jgi:hypothetical protein